MCRRQGDKDFSHEHRAAIGKAYEILNREFRDYVDHMRDIDNKLQRIIHEVSEKNEEAAKKDEKDMNSWVPSWLRFGTKGEIGYNSHENINHLMETRSRLGYTCSHRCLRCSKFILSATQNSVDEKQLSHHPPDYHQN